MNDITAAYLSEATRALRAYKKLAEGALAQISDEEFFHKPDSESLSCGLLVKHIAGNLRSRFTDFLTSDGEKPDRHRDQEFEDAKGATRSRLMRSWEESWALLFQSLEELRPEDVERTVTIRGEPYSVLKALNVASLHYAYHIGQIAYLAKHMCGPRWKSLSVPKPGQEKYTA
ncbi:MAG TPA: DinB family protein [Terriglobales bacterium]|nr:DinB family protein [Terriglobales bacterium]